MKITMKHQITGTRNGKRWPKRGETVALPDDEAAALCAAGMAEPVAEPEKARAEKRTSKKAASKRSA